MAACLPRPRSAPVQSSASDQLASCFTPGVRGRRLVAQDPQRRTAGSGARGATKALPPPSCTTGVQSGLTAPRRCTAVGCAVVRRWPPQEVGGSGGVDGPAGEVVCLAGTSRQGTCRSASQYPQRPSLSQTAWRARLRYLSGGSSLSLFSFFFCSHPHTPTRAPLQRLPTLLTLCSLVCPLSTRCPLAAHRPFLGPLPFSLSPLTPPPPLSVSLLHLASPVPPCDRFFPFFPPAHSSFFLSFKSLS